MLVFKKNNACFSLITGIILPLRNAYKTLIATMNALQIDLDKRLQNGKFCQQDGIFNPIFDR